MSYEYRGVDCSEIFIPLFNSPSPGGYSYGVPVVELRRPVLIRDCPGCHKDHTFQPEELKLRVFPRQQSLHEFEEKSEE